jgi:predicted Zn-dependent peptidase
MHVVLDELNQLKQNISDEELNRAKNQLKFELLSYTEKSEDRLQEIAKNYATFKDLTFHKYCDQIDAVTSSQINRAAERAFGGKPTLVVTGDAINLVPNITDVHKQLH